MKDLDYTITIRIPIKAHDNIDARIKAKTILEDKGFWSDDNIKLQKMNKSGPPDGVDLLWPKES